MRADPSRGLVCRGQNCYGHISEFAPWRLILPIMASETRAIARALSAEHAGAPPLAGTVAAYVRCDAFILEHHDDYGVVPHGFYLDPVRRDPNWALRDRNRWPRRRLRPFQVAMVDDLLRAARTRPPSVSIHQRRSVEADRLFRRRSTSWSAVTRRFARAPPSPTSAPPSSPCMRRARSGRRASCSTMTVRTRSRCAWCAARCWAGGRWRAWAGRGCRGF